MKYNHVIAALLYVVLCTVGCSHDTSKEGFAIKNAAIIDMSSGHISKNMTIIVYDNVITEIDRTEQIDIPASVNIIDATGKFVIPGLWDMHAHTSSESITRDILYPLFIANGVTNIRVMSADCFEPCWELAMTIDQSRGLQDQVLRDSLIGPKAILGSTLIHGARPGVPSTVREPGTMEDGQKLVQLLDERGVDFIKVYDEVPRQAYFGIIEGAKHKGMVVAGHVPTSIKASEASDAGQRSIEHCCKGSILEECSTEEERLRVQITKLLQSREPRNMYGLVLELVQTYDSIQCQELFKKFVSNNTFFTPTLIATEIDNIQKTYDWREDYRLAYLPMEERRYWEEDEVRTKEILGIQDPLIRQKRFEIVQNMNKVGVKLLAGSDNGVFGVFPGFGIHDELELLVEAGLTELEALQTATLNAAAYANSSDKSGNIKVGMMADMVLLNANPLENIGNTKKIDAVLSNGNFLGREELDTIFEKILSIVN